MKTQPIAIWKFDDAPLCYSAEFNPDDADWLCYVPENYFNDYIGFIEEGTSFGNRVEEREYKSYAIRVGYHA